MGSVEEEVFVFDIASPPKPRPRVLRAVALTLFTQYTIVMMGIGLSVAALLHYQVTPQIVAQFEAIARAIRQ